MNLPCSVQVAVKDKLSTVTGPTATVVRGVPGAATASRGMETPLAYVVCELAAVKTRFVVAPNSHRVASLMYKLIVACNDPG